MSKESQSASLPGLLYPQDDLGGESALCLDWVNTVSWRGKPSPTETLTHVGDWLEWIEESRTLPKDSLQRLQRMAVSDPEEAAAGFARAISFREALYRVLASQAKGEAPSAEDRLEFADVLGRAFSRVQLSGTKSEWSLQVSQEPVGWDLPLSPIALSAAQLLSSPHSKRLHVCGRRECLWLFIDRTKNRSRKWCDMTTCGNVVKARRSYARRKAKEIEPAGG